MFTNYSRILYLGFMGFFNDQEIRAAWDELTFPSPSSLRQQGIMHKKCRFRAIFDDDFVK